MNSVFKQALNTKSDVFLCFRNIDEWLALDKEASSLDAIKRGFLEAIQENGYVEPVTGLRREPGQFKLDKGNLHETISAGELNSRKRAILYVIKRTLEENNLWVARRLKILSADGISRIALILRGVFPFFLGAEFLPSEKAKRDFFPVPHMDLCEIEFEKDSFDMFVSADVLEHVPNLDLALTELFKVLRPGGLLVSSFPFSPNSRETVIKAKIDEEGKIVHLMEPEYHGNPVDPEAGSLVFSLPGWDILSKLRDIGFSDAYFASVLSARHGILSNGRFGPFVLVARK